MELLFQSLTESNSSVPNTLTSSLSSPSLASSTNRATLFGSVSDRSMIGGSVGGGKFDFDSKTKVLSHPKTTSSSNIQHNHNMYNSSPNQNDQTNGFSEDVSLPQGMYSSSSALQINTTPSLSRKAADIFNEKFNHPTARPLATKLQKFVTDFLAKPPSPEKQGMIVRSFLDQFEASMASHPLWANNTVIYSGENSAVDGDLNGMDLVQICSERLEKYLLCKLYRIVFSALPEETIKDELIKKKIQQHSWLRPEHLDISNSSLNSTLLSGINTQLRKIDEYKSPRDKLVCIVNACKIIHNMFHTQEGIAASADHSLPVLIFSIIQSNPPNIYSNLQYISRYRNPSRMINESGYLFTHFLSAITFIEDLSASSLSITPEEYSVLMAQTAERYRSNSSPIYPLPIPPNFPSSTLSSLSSTPPLPPTPLHSGSLTPPPPLPPTPPLSSFTPSSLTTTPSPSPTPTPSTTSSPSPSPPPSPPSLSFSSRTEMSGEKKLSDQLNEIESLNNNTYSNHQEINNREEVSEQIPTLTKTQTPTPTLTLTKISFGDEIEDWFLNAEASDLRLKDIPLLLERYKKLVHHLREIEKKS